MAQPLFTLEILHGWRNAVLVRQQVASLLSLTKDPAEGEARMLFLEQLLTCSVGAPGAATTADQWLTAFAIVRGAMVGAAAGSLPERNLTRLIAHSFDHAAQRGAWQGIVHALYSVPRRIQGEAVLRAAQTTPSLSAWSVLAPIAAQDATLLETARLAQHGNELGSGTTAAWSTCLKLIAAQLAQRPHRSTGSWSSFPLAIAMTQGSCAASNVALARLVLQAHESFPSHDTSVSKIIAGYILRPASSHHLPPGPVDVRTLDKYINRAADWQEGLRIAQVYRCASDTVASYCDVFDWRVFNSLLFSISGSYEKNWVAALRVYTFAKACSPPSHQLPPPSVCLSLSRCWPNASPAAAHPMQRSITKAKMAPPLSQFDEAALRKLKNWGQPGNSNSSNSIALLLRRCSSPSWSDVLRAIALARCRCERIEGEEAIRAAKILGTRPSASSEHQMALLEMLHR